MAGTHSAFSPYVSIRGDIFPSCEIVYFDGTEARHHYPDIYVEIDSDQELLGGESRVGGGAE